MELEIPQSKPLEKTEEQVKHELFTKNLQSKLEDINTVRKQNPPKSLEEECKLLRDSTLTREEVIHLAVNSTNRLNTVVHKLSDILQSI